jgi:hypothetical protein
MVRPKSYGRHRSHDHLTGTAQEIAQALRRLEAAGLRNVSLNPPQLVRETVRMYAEKVAPLRRRLP